VCNIKLERVRVHQNPVGKSYRNALPIPNSVSPSSRVHVQTRTEEQLMQKFGGGNTIAGRALETKYLCEIR
jgi:hypothetical protein